MNTNTPESNKTEIPLMIRSSQWTIAEKTDNQVSAVCLKNNQDDMIMQLKQQIVQQNQKIEEQNKVIRQQNQMMNQQNRKIDNLNDLLHLQEDINTELRNRIEILERIEQNKDKGKTVSRQSMPNETVNSPSSGSRTTILMADPNQDSDATVFGSSIKRSEVSAIYTKDTLEDVPSSAWDVSDSKDGSVMAWTSMDSDGKTFILYLAADGDFYANPDSRYLFANYTNLTTADFSHLKTNLVTNMHGMFSVCNNLKQLNVSHWDVSNVTDMGMMFFSCLRIQTLDVSHWDVSSTTHMGSMFWYCKQLQTLDVSQWNVSNVKRMDEMFSNCLYINQLEKGALSSWKLNPSVSMKKICKGTKFGNNPLALFQK